MDRQQREQASHHQLEQMTIHLRTVESERQELAEQNRQLAERLAQAGNGESAALPDGDTVAASSSSFATPAKRLRSPAPSPGASGKQLVPMDHQLARLDDGDEPSV